MKNILIVLHSTKIQNYLAFTINNLAAQENYNIWLEINPSMQPIKSINWNKLERFLNKRNPLFRKDPLDIVSVDEIINEHVNVNWKNELIVNKMDWIILEDATISTNNYFEIAINGLVALDFNKEQVIQEVIENKKITIYYQYKSTSETNWNYYSIQVEVEKSFKNNYDKILWNFSIFLPSLLVHDFKTVQENKIQIVKKRNRIEIKKAILSYQLKLVFTSLKRKWNTKTYNWKIAFEKDDELFFLKQPSNSFWADPFFIEFNGIKALFFEELDDVGKGRIAAVVLNDNFEIIEKQVIIDEEFHLSFPNVYIEKNQPFMIPESSENKNVLLYQCDDFPFKWSLKQSIIDNIRLIDIVWTKHEDFYWVFANKIEDFEYDNNERLNLYFTLDLASGNWKPHPQNPIVFDKGRARNAGKIIIQNGKLVRVSQNCVSFYGAYLQFNEIEMITPNNYQEKYLHSKFPKNPYCGHHTFNTANQYIVSDYLIKE